MTTRLDDMPLVEPANRSEWRGWLAEHHDSSSGVWLAVGKKGNHATSLTYDDAVEEALCFGWIDGKTMTLDEQRFRILATPRKPGSTWAASNKVRVERLTAQGLMAPAGLAAVERAIADGSWTLLDDIDNLTVPDDLAQALERTPPAAENFAALSPSARRIALYWIATAKRPETRERRIAETAAAALDRSWAALEVPACTDARCGTWVSLRRPSRPRRAMSSSHTSPHPPRVPSPRCCHRRAG